MSLASVIKRVWVDREQLNKRRRRLKQLEKYLESVCTDQLVYADHSHYYNACHKVYRKFSDTYNIDVASFTCKEKAAAKCTVLLLSMLSDIVETERQVCWPKTKEDSGAAGSAKLEVYEKLLCKLLKDIDFKASYASEGNFVTHWSASKESEALQEFLPEIARYLKVKE